MTPADDEAPAGFSLRRWSRRKLAVARAAPVPASSPAAPAGGAASPVPGTVVATPGSDAAPTVAPAPLPPVESLRFDSDFTAFMQPKVDEAVKRGALKQLFRDPRFNVMDGLDVYIDDYSKSDPIPPEMLRALAHTRSLFAPVKTRVNAQGWVEDVPPDEAAAGAPVDAEVEDGPPAAAGAPEDVAGRQELPAAATDSESEPLPPIPADAPAAAPRRDDGPAGR